MTGRRVWSIAIVMMGLVGAFAGAVSAQSTTMTETKKFEIISVTGNVLVVKGTEGTREVTVPAGFKFTVDGKQLSVGELKPGMAGTATVTTTVTSHPVVVTEVRQAKVMQAYGNSVILRSQDGGFKLFTSEDASKYKVRIIRDGKEIEFQQLRANDLVSATIVTEKAPQVLTEKQVNASLTSHGEPPMAAPAAKTAAPAPASTPKAAAAPAATPKPAAAPAPAAPAAAPAPKHLPKTASPLPLVGLVGALSLAMGALMTSLRRRRVVR
jgi:hypothetical protein